MILDSAATGFPDRFSGPTARSCFSSSPARKSWQNGRPSPPATACASHRSAVLTCASPSPQKLHEASRENALRHRQAVPPGAGASPGLLRQL
eukprot:scaffold3290_cov259-Pinguiococcus_pyrenoidosus.AAC.17